MALRLSLAPLALAVLLTGCGGTPSILPPQPGAPTATPTPGPALAAVRVLMVTATAAFRHDSIPMARTVVAALAAQSGAFTVTATENLGDVNASRLASTD